jgi:hypothetical protein
LKGTPAIIRQLEGRNRSLLAVRSVSTMASLLLDPVVRHIVLFTKLDQPLPTQPFQKLNHNRAA